MIRRSAARWRGRSRRGRSWATASGASACSCRSTKTIPWRRLNFAFTQALADLGWTDGRNMRMDLRWYGSDTNRIRALAPELVGLQPDIILTSNTPPTAAVQRETRTIPIVFLTGGDPVVGGLVERLIEEIYGNPVAR